MWNLKDSGKESTIVASVRLFQAILWTENTAKRTNNINVQSKHIPE